MNDRIFILKYSDFDYSENYYFAGPETVSQDDFETLCEELLPHAGYKSFLKQSQASVEWITWHDVVESLVSLLERQGYQRINFPTFPISNNGIIGFNNRLEGLREKLGFSISKILEYNVKLEKKLKEEQEKRAKKIVRLKKKTTQIMK